MSPSQLGSPVQGVERPVKPSWHYNEETQFMQLSTVQEPVHRWIGGSTCCQVLRCLFQCTKDRLPSPLWKRGGSGIRQTGPPHEDRGHRLATWQVASDSRRRSEEDRFSIRRFKLCFRLGSFFCARLVTAESDQYVIARAGFESDAVCQSRGFVC